MGASLVGKVAWVTGAGSGIGQAAAVALAAAGAKLVLSGRREGPQEAAAIRGAGGSAAVAPADVADPAAVAAVAGRIGSEFGRCDILVSSAGLNVRRRGWSEVDAAGFATVLAANLAGPFHAAAAVLPMIRARRDGLLIHIACWAGRYVLRMTGPAYTPRSTAWSRSARASTSRSAPTASGPAASAPPTSPRAVPEEARARARARARMLQVRDLAATVLFVAGMPASAGVNEILIGPTWNRFYTGGQPP